MVFFCDSGGVIFNVIPERVFQGSAGVNKVLFVGAFPSNAQVLMAFQLPNGIWTKPTMLSHVDELTELKTEGGKTYSGWVGTIGFTPQIDTETGQVIKDGNGHVLQNLDFSITENYGTCTVQFYVYAASHAISVNINGQIVLTNATGGLLATANSSFEIERGVPAIIPDLSEDDSQVLLTQILNSLSSVSGNVDSLISEAVVAINVTLREKILDIVAKNTFDEDVAGNPVTLPFVKTDGDEMTAPLTITQDSVSTSYGAGGMTNGGKEIIYPQSEGVLALLQDVTNAIEQAIGNVAGFSFIVVAELPTTDIKTNAIYLLPNNESAPNVYDEYVYINGAWEKIGTTAIDLSGYLQTDEFNQYFIEYLTNNPETLTDEGKAAALNWLGALPKQSGVTSFQQVYSKGSSGQQVMVNISSSTVGSSLVQRQANSNIQVPLLPLADGDATPKKYVDEKIGYTHNIHITDGNGHAYFSFKTSTSTPIANGYELNEELYNAGFTDEDNCLSCSGGIWETADDYRPFVAVFGYGEGSDGIPLLRQNPAQQGVEQWDFGGLTVIDTVTL